MEEPKLNSLEKMSQSLGTNYTPDVKNEIAEIKKETKSLTKKVNQPELKDKEYIVEQFKNIVDRASHSLQVLSEDIKIGCNNGSHLAMAELVKAATGTLKELFVVNKMIYETELMEQQVDPETPKETEDKKFMLTSTDLRNMMKMAKEEADMNRIDTSFTIENDKETKN